MGHRRAFAKWRRPEKLQDVPILDSSPFSLHAEAIAGLTWRSGASGGLLQRAYKMQKPMHNRNKAHYPT